MQGQSLLNLVLTARLVNAFSAVRQRYLPGTEAESDANRIW